MIGVFHNPDGSMFVGEQPKKEEPKKDKPKEPKEKKQVQLPNTSRASHYS
jgi:hypothetical protein